MHKHNIITAQREKEWRLGHFDIKVRKMSKFIGDLSFVLVKEKNSLYKCI